MRKEDLKSLMRITEKNGGTAIIYLNTSEGDYVLYCNGGWNSMRRFNDDLTCNYSREDDIVKVEDRTPYSDSYKTIWQREEETVMTIQETEEMLGINNLKTKK